MKDDVKVWAEGLDEAESVCDMCNGYAFVPDGKHEYADSFVVCPKCEGGGKVDWARNAMSFEVPKRRIPGGW